MKYSEYWSHKLKKYNLEEEISDLKDKNKKLIKENENIKSTKPFKLWKKYNSIKNRINKSNNNSRKKIKDFKVAIIADEFTYNSFKHEFIPITITPNNWEQKFKKYKPDLFFCESAWKGYDENEIDPWEFKIPKMYKEKTENRTDLFKIIEYCNKNNIPTVFWNKEDPPHYRNEIRSFAETANKFDYIFTTSDKCLNKYKEDFNHDNVHILMFAGQPKLFNPLKLNNETEDKIVFAGSYYPNHKKRCELMDNIFDKIITQWEGKLKIFDRIYYEKWAEYPERFKQYTYKPIPYEETSEVYKKVNWGLNLNTVTDSETMFARRVFELALSYTFILTNYSVGVDKIFGDNVFVFDDMETLPDFNYSNIEKKINNLYNVLENHTYTNRWKQILNIMGLEYAEDIDDITLIFEIDDLNELDDTIKKYNSINYSNKTLAILITNESINRKNINQEIPSQVDNIYFKSDASYKKKLKKEIKTEYWMVIDKDIDNDFIKKAILHYQYLNKRISITENEDKFVLNVETDIKNKIINKNNLNYLDNAKNEVDVYYI